MLSLLKIARAGKASARGGIACPASLLVTCLRRIYSLLRPFDPIYIHINMIEFHEELCDMSNIISFNPFNNFE